MAAIPNVNPAAFGAAAQPVIGGPAVATAVVNAFESTSSTSFTDLATVGPSVTLVVGRSGMVRVSLRAQIDAASGLMSVDLSGQNVVAGSDDYAVYSTVSGFAFGTTFILTGLRPGATTFKAVYRKTGGTPTFGRRGIIVENVISA